jgi:hypothetical protein
VSGRERGLDSVAMTTPDETMATAIFVGEEVPSARVVGPSPGRGRERGGRNYYLLERISLAHEDAPEEHGYGKSW